MLSARSRKQPKSAEKDFAFEFERAHFITLGLLYERSRGFSAGLRAAAQPVDGISHKPLKDAIDERVERADQSNAPMIWWSS